MSSSPAAAPSATAPSSSTTAPPPSNPPSSSSTSTRGNGRPRNRRGRGAKGIAQQQIPAIQAGEAANAPPPSTTSSRGGGTGRGSRGGRGGRGGSSRGGRGGGRAGAQNGVSQTGEGAEAAQGDATSTPIDGPSAPTTSTTRQQRLRNQSRSRQPTAQAQDGLTPSSSTAATNAEPNPNAEQPKPPARGGRRAKFNASLSSSTSLHPTAASFTPSTTPSHAHSHNPAPVSQTLLSRLTTELTSGTAECSICVSDISRTARIHSCSTCSTPFHLNCIKEWATRSVNDSAERARLLATSANPPTDPRATEGSWRCPSCQSLSYSPSSIPTRYHCYCHRLLDPSHRPPTTPHSCGQPCAKPRPEGCGHETCGLMCHPGPCPPCSVVLEKSCWCGDEEKRVRCSAMFPPRGVVSVGEEKEALLSCGKICAKMLECGMHVCERVCHEGACGGCEEVRRKRCFCGRGERVEGCGVGSEARVEGCRRVGKDGEEEKSESWLGEWSCEEVCGAPFDCTHHSCTSPCHAHTSPSPLPVPSHPLKSQHATTSRICSSSAEGGEGEGEEFMCGRVCKAMRTCGRHQCNRVCCPLSYQEALQLKSTNKRRGATNEQWQVEDDPLGIHACDRVCGRKLNCGVHFCEMGDHRGACGPCLRADFDELVCNCGSTVVLPPIPCSYTIDCRHPCIRPSSCGHQTMPHACHEDPIPCPPCPFLVEKECACGKKRVGNVRCSLGKEKVSCGTVCGKLLRCGFHRCRRSCHPSGSCESCDQTCLKPLRLCHHPCPSPCHSPTSCPTDSPCPKLITVTCACGHLQQSARCGSCDAKPEGNQGRLLKCGDACAAAKRSKQLAEALGVEKREPRVREVEYEPLMLSFYGANVAWCNSIEAQLAEFVKGDIPSLHFPVMKRPQRAFTHELAELFDLRSESLDEEPRRSVVVHRQSNSAIPTPTLANALIAQRKSASTTLTFGSLRKPTQPEKKASNAIYLEGVLGFDEAMLKDILRPLTRGLVFSCTWVGEEDVLVTFDTSVPEILDPKLPLMVNSFRTLASDTGFCATVEPVHLSPEDGKITRGAWTPVASTSRSSGGNSWRNGASQNVFTPNAFASLGGGGTQSAPTPARTAWGAGGGVVGPAAYKVRSSSFLRNLSLRR
ncbi:hypothetical protein BCR35DRAFT_305534 [Leucosporidium creatinivorum]|uniref:R3H domain-containing protein n=1 Tax=Leucosporidium creatinivorum TaxID=106004 RepID=A0A1Y2F037_9BASI|nr:hypothetical protein BCR35DRAFT_305534 [Leucosporidium creatinivorum]